MKRVLGVLGAAVAATLLVSIFYLTCITEVEKTWMDLDAGDSYGQTTEPLYEGTAYCQHFIAQRGTVNEMLIRVITWGRAYAAEDRLSVELVAEESGEVVGQCAIPLSDFADNCLYALPFSGLHLEKGSWYVLRIAGHAEEEAHSISLMLSDRGDPGWEFCEKEDGPMERNLSIIIRGRGMV